VRTGELTPLVGEVLPEPEPLLVVTHDLPAVGIAERGGLRTCGGLIDLPVPTVLVDEPGGTPGLGDAGDDAHGRVVALAPEDQDVSTLHADALGFLSFFFFGLSFFFFASPIRRG
jgi:hypothetical protein